MKTIRSLVLVFAALAAAAVTSAGTRSIYGSGDSLIAGVIAGSDTTIGASGNDWIVKRPGDGDWEGTENPAYLPGGWALTAGATGGSVSAYTTDSTYTMSSASVRGFIQGAFWGAEREVQTQFDTDSAEKSINILGDAMDSAGVDGATDFSWQIWSDGGSSSGTGEAWGITGHYGQIYVRVYTDYLEFDYYEQGEIIVEVNG